MKSPLIVSYQAKGKEAHGINQGKPQKAHKMVITWKGKKATVKTENFTTVYTLKKVSGIVSQTLYTQGGKVLKGGFQSLPECKEWLEKYCKGLK